MSKEPENFTGRIIFLSMSTTSHGDLKTRKKNANQVLSSFLYAKRFSARQWPFLGPGSEKKWYSTSEDSA